MKCLEVKSRTPSINRNTRFTCQIELNNMLQQHIVTQHRYTVLNSFCKFNKFERHRRRRYGTKAEQSSKQEV